MITSWLLVSSRERAHRRHVAAGSRGAHTKRIEAGPESEELG
jgi:hypothetical protein